MKKYRVLITSSDYGEFIIEAENEEAAQLEAEQRLENGDVSWVDEFAGGCEVTDVIEN